MVTHFDPCSNLSFHFFCLTHSHSIAATQETDYFLVSVSLYPLLQRRFHVNGKLCLKQHGLFANLCRLKAQMKRQCFVATLLLHLHLGLCI